jgi:hypothetical protein
MLCAIQQIFVCLSNENNNQKIFFSSPHPMMMIMTMARRYLISPLAYLLCRHVVLLIAIFASDDDNQFDRDKQGQVPATLQQ